MIEKNLRTLNCDKEEEREEEESCIDGIGSNEEIEIAIRFRVSLSKKLNRRFRVWSSTPLEQSLVWEKKKKDEERRNSEVDQC